MSALIGSMAIAEAPSAALELKLMERAKARREARMAHMTKSLQAMILKQRRLIAAIEQQRERLHQGAA
jgi:hypothetical protein